jgi:hypothetical protein
MDIEIYWEILIFVKLGLHETVIYFWKESFSNPTFRIYFPFG